MAERPEDLNLPNAVVTRIIKDAIPEGVNVSKEARLAISKAASVFVLYATSCSNNFALKGKRKTISAQDVVAAMEDMEFEQFTQPLTEYLNAYRSGQKSKKDAATMKKKLAESAQESKEETNANGHVSDEEETNQMAVEIDDDDDDDDDDDANTGEQNGDSDVVEISD